MLPSTISVALRLHPLLVLCGCLPTLRRPDPQLLLLRLLLNLVVEVQPLRPVLSSALAVDSCQAALQQLLADVLFERAGPVGHHAHHPLVLVPTEHLHRDGFALKLLSSEGCGVIAPGLAGFTKLGGLRGVHCSDAYHDGVLGKLALELSIREKGLVADAIGITVCAFCDDPCDGLLRPDLSCRNVFCSVIQGQRKIVGDCRKNNSPHNYSCGKEPRVFQWLRDLLPQRFRYHLGGLHEQAIFIRTLASPDRNKARSELLPCQVWWMCKKRSSRGCETLTQAKRVVNQYYQ
mmetsp:Transcript_23435/g.38502  ORF Transcript_23435/g.38502 Transcript_23435/m.38502 type:complete len:291 (-) Transcript_23435:36-908(-)